MLVSANGFLFIYCDLAIDEIAYIVGDDAVRIQSKLVIEIERLIEELELNKNNYLQEIYSIIELEIQDKGLNAVKAKRIYSNILRRVKIKEI